jgi:glutamate synthase (NADPH/NADH) large chain
MSGGIAYVLDTTGRFDYFCNMEMVELSLVETFEDINKVKQMVENHYKYTNSELAKTIVNDWGHYIGKFIKIIPYEFKKILEERKIADIEQKMEKLEHE